MSGLTDVNARAVFLTALEYGVSPIVPADYTKQQEEVDTDDTHNLP